MKNYAYNSMNFNSLSTERDKRDFGLIKYERRKPRSIAFGYYAMSGTSQKNSKIQKFKNSTVKKKNISLVQLKNAAISLLN